MAKNNVKIDYVVYEIVAKNTRVYIGHTNNLKRRQSEHNNHCFKKLAKKELYDYLREIGETKITLTPVATFDTKTECKRYECYLILEDYFADKKLKQKCPNISDGF